MHDSGTLSLPTPDGRLPRLYAIVDVDVAQRAHWRPRDLGRAYLAGGARFIQLRAKSLASGPLLDIAEEMAADTAEAGGLFILNDRPDLAVLAHASGVHVGQDDLPAGEARRLVGPDGIVGLSTHTREQIHAAIESPVSYLAVGPMFDTSTKATGYEAVGLPLLQDAVAAARTRQLPVVAIGGVTLDRAPALIAAGAASVCVITDLMTEDPEARAREYTAALR
jgi:thiamine-phosphate pyrophosphorylase